MPLKIPRPEFPRPDLVREDWLCLNGAWAFSFDTEAFDREIIVPFCYQSAASGIGDGKDHNTVWYRRSFAVDDAKLREGRRLLLKFGAVDSQANVWVNGRFAGAHEGGYTPFEFDITALVQGGENELKVCAQDSRSPDKPRGKQSWIGKSFGCWYTPVTGIWQSVWLEYAGGIYISRVKCTPDVARLEALCELFVSDGTSAQAQVTASVDGKPLCQQTVQCSNGYGKAVLAFPDYDLRRSELLWTPENPNLVEVCVTLRPTGGHFDTVQTYFGMRSVSCSSEAVTLNGEPYYQRLVLDQGYWKESLLTPPSDEAIRRDIELTKAMGFNGVRKHQKIEDPRYYYWADKLGLLVWGELPSAYLFNDNAVHACSETLFRFVERDFNHPCIVAWVPVNESWGVRNVVTDQQQQNFCRMLTYQLKALDKTRPVSANDGWEQISETDICAIHDYALLPATLQKYNDLQRLLNGCAERRFVFAQGNQWTGQPVMLTEYGGIAFVQDQDADAWGYYDRVHTNEEFLARLSPVTKFLLQSGRFAGFCYTQLTDVMQEINGLLTEERQPKLPVETLHSIFAQRAW